MPGLLCVVVVVDVVVVAGEPEVVGEPPDEVPVPDVVASGVRGTTIWTTACSGVDESVPEPGGGVGFTGVTGGAG